VAALAYGIDRLTKYLADHHLAGRPAIDVIPGVVRLRYTTNSGGAFGLLGGHAWLFFVATIVVCLVIVYSSIHLDSTGSAVGLGLILGGAVGNLTDRVLSGRVPDFVDFRVWPVFNAADSAIVIGAVVMIAVGLRSRPHDRSAEPTPGAP
jgi:signal peptidase II